jgi:hypothetical protein
MYPWDQVTVTGAFAGAGIQYVIPATLVLLARSGAINCMLTLTLMLMLTMMLMLMLRLTLMLLQAEAGGAGAGGQSPAAQPSGLAPQAWWGGNAMSTAWHCSAFYCTMG